MTRLIHRAATAATGLLLSGAALAHTGSTPHGGHGWPALLDGLAHPFGADHLLAMVAVGAWCAAALPAARRWLGPLVFLLAMAGGALLAGAGLVLPGLEQGIALSVLLLGVMLAAGGRVPAVLGLPLIASAALLHGLAHGVEGPAGAAFVPYALGMLCTTAVLQAAGLRLGLWVGPTAHAARTITWRLAGAGVGAAGLLLLVRA